MSAVRASLALGLFFLQASARVSDESCLVQSQRDVVSKREAALKPDLRSLPALHVDLSFLRQLSKQLPIPDGIPDGLLPDFLTGAMSGDLPMEEIVNKTLEFLGLMKDERIADLMFKSVRNASDSLLSASAVLLAGARTLDEAVDGATEDAQVLEALKLFFLSVGREAAGMMANATVDSRALWALVPTDNSFRKDFEPLFKMTEHSTREGMSSLILSFLVPSTNKLVENKAAFCTQFAPFQANITMASTVLRQQGPGVVEAARSMMPQLVPGLQKQFPEVAPRMLELFNATLDALGEVIASAQESVPAASDALTKAARDRLRCSFPAAERSGAPRARARFVLAAALAAAAARALAA